jgi:hypothetical protein
MAEPGERSFALEMGRAEDPNVHAFEAVEVFSFVHFDPSLTDLGQQTAPDRLAVASFISSTIA